MKLKVFPIVVLSLFALAAYSQPVFDGLQMNMGNLYRMSNAQTRSISAENFTGEKSKGGMAQPGDKTPNKANASWAAHDLGQGWKVNPYINIKPGETFTLAEMEGPGAIQHIWMAPCMDKWRFAILRIYWDDEKNPSVECPLGDFFAMGWNQYAQISSLAVCVNPGMALNCYWVMPFRKKCKITMENINEKDITVYYQVDYTLTQIPDDAAYFHAQFRRQNPTQNSVYTIVDGIKGRGQYVGTYMAIGVTNNGWWGEGEIKFYMDGDKEFPTICGTGTEDYFCGSHDFDTQSKNAAGADVTNYTEFTTPYSGLHQVIKGDGHYNVMQRFGMYRWHILDPIRFEKDLKVTIQDLGWHRGGYLAQHSDIASVCYWYQTEPHAPFPKLPGWQALEVN